MLVLILSLSKQTMKLFLAARINISPVNCLTFVFFTLLTLYLKMPYLLAIVSLPPWHYLQFLLVQVRLGRQNSTPKVKWGIQREQCDSPNQTVWVPYSVNKVPLPSCLVHFWSRALKCRKETPHTDRVLWGQSLWMKEAVVLPSAQLGEHLPCLALVVGCSVDPM